MKILNKLLVLTGFLTFFSFVILSCGTEEELADEMLELNLSDNSVQVGNSISFTLNSSIKGDVTSQAIFYVNEEPIEGNIYVPQTPKDDNTVYGEYDGRVSATKTFASVESIPSEYTQKVLIEDYTGTWCGYCPRMVTILNYLTEYSDRIIPVAIHCLGAPLDPWTYEYNLDMTNPDNYNAQGQPKGKINRIYELDQLQGTYPCPYDRDVYTPQLLPYLNETAVLGLGINSSLSGNNLSIDVKVGFVTDDIPEARLVVNLIEDGLKHEQTNYYAGSGNTCDPEYDYANMPQHIPDFPQEHVLLKSYTDIFGDVIPQQEIADGNVWTRNFNVQLPDNVTNSDNLTIVAFVLGNGDEISNREVINVQSAKINTEQDFD